MSWDKRQENEKDEFAVFLRTNRPQPPSPRANESIRIWERILEQIRARSGQHSLGRRLRLGLPVAAVLLVAFGSVLLQTGRFSVSSVEPLNEAELTAVSDSLDLGFMDTPELAEVGELIALSD